MAFLVAVFAAMAGSFGEIGTAVGLATAPIFLASASIGLRGSGQRGDNKAVTRYYAGISNSSDEYLGGNVPSVAYWDPNGKLMGYDHRHQDHIKPGAHVDYGVTMISNARPEYMAISAQSHDEICLAGVALTLPDVSEPLMLLGDVLAMCGMPWYQSLQKIADADKAPLCVWMDGAKKPEYHEQWHSVGVMNPMPDGFVFRIPDFMGSVVNDEVIAQRKENMDFQCKHPARLNIMHDMRGQFSIPIFQNRPLPKGDNETDLPDFLEQPTQQSEPLKHSILSRTAETEEEDEELARTAADRKYQYHHFTLSKGPQSANNLCSSSTSLGPDWYSYETHDFCHMATKTLLPGCSEAVTEDCFDAETHKIRHKQCPPGRKCTRALSHIPEKEYVQVNDFRVINRV